MVGRILTGEALSEQERVLTALGQFFAESGFAPVQPQHLFRADTLLDLYGEDIRARAFVFPDPGTGHELCLRPDFTVPVALAHGRDGWNRRAAYAYQGPVFRRQPSDALRPIEYLQAGIESYGEADHGTADARIIAQVLRGLEEIGAPRTAVTTGDLGIVFALLDAIPITARRRAALRRHLWRPQRFHELLDGFVAHPPTPTHERAALIAEARAGAGGVERRAIAAGEVLGLRDLDDVVARAAALAAHADEPSMPPEQAALIEGVLDIEGASGASLTRLRTLTSEGGVDITPALDRFEARLDALNRVGIDAEELPFEAAFGRNLEYYDGFVFEVVAEGRPGLPPLAGGGRYDAMTMRLGAGRPVPAVGAMIRPEAALAGGRR